MTRDKIFISHATPEDNEFAIWLASKLELFGYKVWVDVNSLVPADDFWNTIETAIRNESIRFIFVVTKASIHKAGVKKELAVADRVKKSLENFIIPARLDDFDFNDFPTEIIRLNTIDFKDNWGRGLYQLLETLEKSNIKKANTIFNSEEIVNRWNSIKSSQNSNILIRDE